MPVRAKFKCHAKEMREQGNVGDQVAALGLGAAYALAKWWLAGVL